jgi:hypothetical protein
MQKLATLICKTMFNSEDAHFSIITATAMQYILTNKFFDRGEVNWI